MQEVKKFKTFESVLNIIKYLTREVKLINLFLLFVFIFLSLN